MKKILFAVLCTLCLAACNTKLGPEYSTRPIVQNLTYYPTSVSADQSVEVTASVTSTYGLQSIAIAYYLNEDTQKILYDGIKYYVSLDEVTEVFTGSIPKQPAGTKVTFQILATSFYKVMGASIVKTYTVEEASVPEPEPESNSL